MEGFNRLLEQADTEEQVRLQWVKVKLADHGFSNDLAKLQGAIGQNPAILKTFDIIWEALQEHPNRILVTNDIKLMNSVYSFFPILAAYNHKGVSTYRLNASEMVDLISDIGDSQVYKKLSRFKLIILGDLCKSSTRLGSWSASIEYIITNLLGDRFILITNFTTCDNELDAKKEVITKIKLTYSSDMSGMIRQTFKPFYLLSDCIDYF